ncbi:MAG: type I DNA topoisomerase [Planctomycetaceae bacterium]|jgi:DNA topoisomerase-1|nr:type I DNA topoisomerase [Planctomycetaceae bacterium]
MVSSKSENGYSLVIVESPAKARTIGRILGDGYRVEASIGHIRDLPRNSKDVPAKYKKEKWANLGVNVYSNFEPIYVVTDEKRKQVKKLSELLESASDLYLATDEDREGEAISWHLVETLKPKLPIRRLVFHEITKKAITDALDSPRQIDDDLVQAQETRRIIDRLYGYEISPLLWRKVGPKLSAGRVQSVAVRLIVERERERIAFHSATYWDILGSFAEHESAKSFQANLISVANRKIPVGKDFDTKTGRLINPDSHLLLDEQNARELAERLKTQIARIKSVEEKPYIERPYAPFTTSTLQQEANRKLGFTARTTMSLAQGLYENGHITYMRTDSTNLSDEAINASRNLVLSQYGKEYLPDSPRIYKTNVKNAQEAHEAIRPAGSTFELPENLRDKLTREEFRLYELIWKRTVASQMSDARGKRKQLIVEVDDALFSVSGKTIEFAGYLRAYVEGSDDPNADLADREILLPPVKTGDEVKCIELEPKSHVTMPPSRYSEAALTKELTERGIGRPSTYASIIETILNRNYVFKKGGALVPTWVAFAVNQLMEEHLPDLINYDFTAQMEDQLDAISRGEAEHLDYLKEFYFGGKRHGLKQLLDDKIEAINARDVCTIPVTQSHNPTNQTNSTAATTTTATTDSTATATADTGAATTASAVVDPTQPIVVRVGKFGPYLQQGELTANLPDELPPDELTIDKAVELLISAQRAEEPLGFCPETKKPIYVKNGRFGPYVQRGFPDDEDKQNASLLKGMTLDSVDLATALKLLALPRNLGKNPATGNDILARDGKFGPYIVCGDETRSLPDWISPLDIDFDKAMELLSQPKTRAVRGANKGSKEPLKLFGDSPITGKPVKLLAGRFGNYITDGETNATLPKGFTVEELTFDRAVDLLAEKAAKGTTAPKKKFTRSTTTKKSTPKTTKRKTTKK